MPMTNGNFRHHGLWVYDCIFFRGARRDGHAGTFFSSGTATGRWFRGHLHQGECLFFFFFFSSFLSYVEHDEHGGDIPPLLCGFVLIHVFDHLLFCILGSSRRLHYSSWRGFQEYDCIFFITDFLTFDV